MSERQTSFTETTASRRRCAWLACTLVAVLATVALVSSILTLADSGELAGFTVALLRVVSVLLFALLAALITLRRPENRFGPVLLVLAISIALQTAADTYSYYGLVTSPGSLPGAEIAAWLDIWLWIISIMPLLTLLFLYFPDGELPSPRWRPVAIAITANLILLALIFPFIPGALDEAYPQVMNPFGIESLTAVTEPLSIIAMALLVPSVIVSAASLVRRFRRSIGIERQQFKWLAVAAMIAILLFGLTMAAYAVTGSDNVWDYWIAASPPVILFATAVAILRYRLYEIDRIISRTIVYALLSVNLGVIYVSLVVGLQALFRPFGDGSDLAIVTTTLVVAALFLPARRRIQDAVDRRFNRRAYDAAQTIDAFNARLRQEVDLDTLTHDLLAVVNDTMQPANVSLWLRGEGVSK